MKRIVAIFLTLILVFSMVACDKQEKGEIVILTDYQDLNDQSFNQSLWEGITAFSEDNKKTYAHYAVKDTSKEGYDKVIENAINDGAKIVIAAGTTFDVAIYDAQKKFPSTKFIIIDGNPNNGDKKNLKHDIRENTVSIKFAEEQSGFLAGYSMVKEGYTKLGFMGGMVIGPVIKYGSGFVQGAETAAKEMSIKNPIQINYKYMGNFIESDDALNIAKTWYEDGTEVIFSCGGEIINSVVKAANKKDGKIVGVDVDQSHISDRIITSAMKSLGEAINGMLFLCYSDEFPGGKEVVLGADAMGVGLPLKNSKFEKFTKKDYKEIFDKLASGAIKIQNTEADDLSKLSSDFVKVAPDKTK